MKSICVYERLRERSPAAGGIHATSYEEICTLDYIQYNKGSENEDGAPKQGKLLKSSFASAAMVIVSRATDFCAARPRPSYRQTSKFC